MITTPRNIERVLKAFFGKGWVSNAAEAIGCHEDTIRRWTSGKTHPSSRWLGILRRVLDEKMEELRELRGEL